MSFSPRSLTPTSRDCSNARVAKTGKPAKDLTFEQALSKLEGIVKAIEQGQVGLEESIRRFETGMELIQRCRTVLAEAERKIQKLQPSSDGTLTPVPLALEAVEEEES